MKASLIDGVISETVLMWSAVSIGVANWMWERLRGQQDGRWESGILWAFMVGHAGEGLMVVMVHIFSNSSIGIVSAAKHFTKQNG